MEFKVPADDEQKGEGEKHTCEYHVSQCRKQKHKKAATGSLKIAKIETQRKFLFK